MGEIATKLESAGRIDRFYVECDECGAYILDSAKRNLIIGAWNRIESIALGEMEAHTDNRDHNNFTVVVDEKDTTPTKTQQDINYEVTFDKGWRGPHQ